MKRATALRYARDTDLTAAQPEQRSPAKGEHPMLTRRTPIKSAGFKSRAPSSEQRGECAELCDFIGAWCAENSVELREAQQWVDAETGEIIGGVQ